MARVVRPARSVSSATRTSTRSSSAPSQSDGDTDDSDACVAEAIQSLRTILGRCARDDRRVVDEFHDAASKLSAAQLDEYIGALRPREEAKLRRVIRQLISDADSQKNRISAALEWFDKPLCPWNITALHLVAVCGPDVISRTMLQEWRHLAESRCPWDTALDGARREMSRDDKKSWKGRSREWRKQYITQVLNKWTASAEGKAAGRRHGPPNPGRATTSPVEVDDCTQPSHTPTPSRERSSMVPEVELGRPVREEEAPEDDPSMWSNLPDMPDMPPSSPPPLTMRPSDRLCVADSPIGEKSPARRDPRRMLLAGTLRQRLPSSPNASPGTKGPSSTSASPAHKKCKVKPLTPPAVTDHATTVSPDHRDQGPQGWETSERDVETCRASLACGATLSDATLEAALACFAAAAPRVVILSSQFPSADLAAHHLAASADAQNDAPLVLVPRHIDKEYWILVVVDGATQSITAFAPNQSDTTVAVDWARDVWSMAFPESTVDDFDVVVAEPDAVLDTHRHYSGDYAFICALRAISHPACVRPSPDTCATWELTRDFLRVLFADVRSRIDARLPESLEPLLPTHTTLNSMTAMDAMATMSATTARLDALQGGLVTLLTLKTITRRAFDGHRHCQAEHQTADRHIASLTEIIRRTADFPPAFIALTTKALAEMKDRRHNAQRTCQPLEPESALMAANMWLDLMADAMTRAEASQKMVQERSRQRVEEVLRMAERK